MIASAGSGAGARPALRVDSLVVHHRGGPPGARRVVHAVEDVSLVVERGEALGVIGESGGGKSTLARAIVRLIEPSAGRIEVDGVDVRALDPPSLRRFRARMQIVLQEHGAALDPRHAAARAIAEPLRLHRVVEPGAIPAEVARLLAAVGLDEALGARLPHELSGGQRQRVAIARALALRPSLLVADEPLAALDASHRARVLNLLAERRDRNGMSLLLIAHDLAAVHQVCDRAAVLYAGRIVEQADAAVLLRRPRHPYTRALVDAAPALTAGARRFPPLTGGPPSPAALPPGCAFHPRCPRYQALGRPDRCVDERPALAEHGRAGHPAACHFPDDVI